MNAINYHSKTDATHDFNVAFGVGIVFCAPRSPSMVGQRAVVTSNQLLVFAFRHENRKILP